jgi:hypothetical protein
MTVESGRHLTRIVALAAVFAGLCSRAAFAQGSVSDVLSFLVTNQAVITDDFVKDQQAAAATRDTIFRFLQVELATLPISSSTGGFIYRFNPTLGTMERASDSFGPFFLERALTSGRGQTSIGFSYRHSRFDTLDGRELRDGTLVTTANRLANEPAPFDVERLTLRLATGTYTFFGSYGVTDRLDISAAVPIVDLTLSGERLNVYRGAVFQQATGSASVTGLADVALRAKYSILQTREAGVAANVEVRLPTGNEEQFLGAGSAAFHASAVASVEGRRIGSHFRAGFVAGGVSDEVDFGAAVVLAATSRFNIVGEIFGRKLSELTRIAEVTAPHPQLPNVATTRLLPESVGANTAFALAGFKWNFAETWLLNANVLFPLTSNGLTGRPTPSIAIDYTFDRK